MHIYTLHGTMSYTSVSQAASWPSTWKPSAGCDRIKKEISRKERRATKKLKERDRNQMKPL